MSNLEENSYYPVLYKSPLRHRVFILLKAEANSKVGRQIDTFIIFLIALSILAVILESEASLAKEYHTAFLIFEWFSTLVFSVEYLTRLWICVEEERYRHPIKGRIKYIFSPMALVDLLAIMPFYLAFFVDSNTVDARFIRGIRLFRLFRLFKIGRYSESITELLSVFSRKKEELAITFFAVIILLILSASVIYLVEHKAQPQAFSSIPAAMWWGVATLTTVGYGDVYPITSLGKFCGSIIALLGVGIVALPAGIIASGFNETIQERKQGKQEPICLDCPHCGKEIFVDTTDQNEQ
jgi:voltage-gated potassium channel